MALAISHGISHCIQLSPTAYTACCLGMPWRQSCFDSSTGHSPAAQRQLEARRTFHDDFCWGTHLAGPTSHHISPHFNISSIFVNLSSTPHPCSSGDPGWPWMTLHPSTPAIPASLSPSSQSSPCGCSGCRSHRGCAAEQMWRRRQSPFSRRQAVKPMERSRRFTWSWGTRVSPMSHVSPMGHPSVNDIQ